MIHIQRSYPAPATLTSDKAQEAREKLEQSIQAKQTQLEIHSNLYGAKDVKQTLMEMQHGKCCFCETKIRPGHYGDVEHFRPKKAVREKDGHLRRPGYYWLAYTWENLLLSCAICNRRYKGNKFPIEGERAKRPKDNLDQERPLFIDPTGQDDPETLITFTYLGQAVEIDGNERGKITIEELGLDREALDESRHKRLKYIQALLMLKQLAKQHQEKTKLAYATQQLERHTRADAEYAGLARSFLKRQREI